MTRKEHLEFCKICLNRKFDPRQGIICKISNRIADFDSTCNYFEVDEKEKEVVFQKKMKATGDYKSGDEMDFKKNKTNGSVLFLIGIAVLLISFSASNMGIVIVPFGMIIYGASVYFRGVKQEEIWKEEHESTEHKKRRNNIPPF